MIKCTVNIFVESVHENVAVRITEKNNNPMDLNLNTTEYFLIAKLTKKLVLPNPTSSGPVEVQYSLCDNFRHILIKF